jgi:hypothetical protein
MKVYVVIESDCECHHSVEAVFTKKPKAEAYAAALDSVDRHSSYSYSVEDFVIDAPHTMPAVIGFRAVVTDAHPPSCGDPVIVGREPTESGRYEGGQMKGVRYARADGETHRQATQNAIDAMEAVGPKQRRSKAKKK